MIEFSCTYCGRKFRVADERSGKRGKCPNCKSTIIVPEPRVKPEAPDDAQSAADFPEDKKPGYDLTLLDVQKKEQEAGKKSEPELPEGALSEEMLACLPGHLRREEPEIQERKLPWILDIFLYPLNHSGIAILGMIVGIPMFLRILIAFLGVLTAAFPPAIVILVFTWVVLILLSLVFYLYLAWYIWECIRESALGGIRAPETAGVTPGLGELLWQMLRMLLCAASFLMPAGLYIGYTGMVDGIFFALCGYGILFLPMSILAIVMFDSFLGLNPFLLLGSIFSAPFSYAGLYIVFILVSLPAVLVVSFIPFNWFTFFISEGLIFYAMLISAHMLGRFFWRCREKLNWEV